MPKFIMTTILLLVTMTVQAEIDTKKIAISAVKEFFSFTDQKLVFEGSFVETDSNYGENCKVVVDFSRVGEEYLTIIGEYTPMGNIGDGIYFNENKSTFEQIELKNGFLALEQKITDSFTTGMKTKVVLRKNLNNLELSLYQKKRFLLFFTQTVKKKCIVENYKK